MNECCDFKHFVIVAAKFSKDKKRIVVELRARANSKPICSGCQILGPGYDRLPEKQVQFIPFWGFQVFFNYAMRRVDCKNCGVKVESVPWASGKQTLTHHYAKYLADWAKDISWKRVAQRFRTSWQTVYRAVEIVVSYGLAHGCVKGVESLGIDELNYQTGHKYMTLVYQIDKGCKRLLWVGKGRTKKTMRRFFADMWHLDRSFRKNIKVVCTDMWKAYLQVIKEKIPHAINILDRFHVMQKFSKALDQIRVQEVKRLKAEGKEPVLKHSRWCFLKRRFNLTRSQRGKLKELVEMNLNIVKAYLLKEQFHKFWEYKSPTWAGKFLTNWCELVKEAELQNHRELLLNYFRAKKSFNSAIVEGLNLKINLTIRKAFGFRSFQVLQTALYHQLGELPEPTFTHEFW